MNNAQLTCTARHVIACACHTSLERTKRIAKGSLRYRHSVPLMSKCCKKAKADLEGLGLDVRQALAVSRRCGVCAAQGVSQFWDHVNSEHCQFAGQYQSHFHLGKHRRCRWHRTDMRNGTGSLVQGTILLHKAARSLRVEECTVRHIQHVA